MIASGRVGSFDDDGPSGEPGVAGGGVKAFAGLVAGLGAAGAAEAGTVVPGEALRAASVAAAAPWPGDPAAISEATGLGAATAGSR
jgi:hypothetical protein